MLGVSGMDTSGYPFASMDTSSLTALQQMALQAPDGATLHLSQVCMLHLRSCPTHALVASPAAVRWCVLADGDEAPNQFGTAVALEKPSRVSRPFERRLHCVCTGV